MKSNQIFSKTMAAVAIALPALGILALTGCTSDETFETPANEARTVTFTAVAPEGAGSRALWDDATTGKLGFEWEAETDTKIDLYWTGATEPMQREATLDGHDGASVTVTGTVPEGATEVVALFPANTIQVGDGEMYRTLPTELTQVGAGTAHLRNYMYLNGTLPIGEVTEGEATMQLAHGCAVLRFNVRNSGGNTVRVTRVEMLAASGKTGVNTRAAITAANAESGIIHSAPQNIAVAVQDATDATKGYTLNPGVGSLAVYAHCFPTAIEDGQFQFLVTVTDANGENEKTYITKEAFSVANITTTDDANTAQKMFKAGYYYTFQLDIAGSRFEELQDYTTQTDEGDNVTGYIVNTYAGLQAWRAAVMNEDDTMKDEDLNLTLGMDITLPAVAEGESNWTPVGGAYVNSTYQTYTGTIDGAGHTIFGLVINSSNLGGNGFIGRMDGGSITNLKLADVSVTGSDYTGALVGNATNTHISDCEVTGGTVSGSGYMGGLIGRQSDGSITRCINRAAVTTTGQYAGGIVGSASGLTISECGNYGSVATSHESNFFAGGMAGGAVSLTIQNCTNYASFITGQYAGYLAGYAEVADVSGCKNQSGNSDLKEYGFLANM